MSGTLRLHRRGLVAIDFLDHVDESYGVAEEGLGLPTNDNAIQIPANTFYLQEDHFHEFTEHYRPFVREH